MNKHFVEIKPGYILAYGEAIDAETHSHPLWQLCLPLGEAELNDTVFTGGFIINPGEKHKVSMPCGWILLAEPESLLGEFLSKLDRSELPSVKEEGTDKDSFIGLWSDTKIKELLNTPKTICITHSKIQSLVNMLDSCFEGGCIKPEHWRARQVAESLAISESRFLHLVKEQVGIAWRPYLLWRRLLCAVREIMNGKSATEAAYIAGFSDSAHLSRTIKNTFGMTLTSLLISFNTK